MYSHAFNHLRRWGLIFCSTALVVLASTNCSVAFLAETTPTIVPTTAPERIKLINGEVNPCLLVKPEEVEIALGVKVSTEIKLLDYMPSCKYLSTTDETVLLIISAVTDMSIQKANQAWLKKENVSITAVEVYDRLRMSASRAPEINKFRDLDSLGDQAFLEQTSFLVIRLLKHNIFYQFAGRTDYDVDEDTLVKLVRVGIERMP